MSNDCADGHYDPDWTGFCIQCGEPHERWYMTADMETYIAPEKIELFTKEGKPVGVYYCSGCKHIVHKDYLEELCSYCTPHEIQYPQKKCEQCPTMQRHLYKGKLCGECRDVESIKTGKLKVVDDDGGPYFACERFFTSIEGLYDHLIDDLWEEVEDKAEIYDIGSYEGRLPKLIYLSNEAHMVMNADSLVENALSDAYEDAYDDISKEAVTELQKVLDEWCEKQGLTWQEESNRVLLFDIKAFEAELNDRKDA